VLGLGLLAAACGNSPEALPPATAETEQQPTGELLGLQLTPVVAGLSSPVAAAAPPGDPRLFIVEKTGTVRIYDEGLLLAAPYLDVRDLVSIDHLERGLLGLEFHPDYVENGRLFVFYTDRNGTSQLVEYRVDSADPNVVDLDTARTLLSVEQFHPAHQGAAMAFGPDGYLWVTVGDGGILSDGEGGIDSDPMEHGQNPSTVLGTVLRLDVDSTDQGYAIPSDNPFVNGGGAPEVWAYGLRNPWRITFDEDLVYISDVGHEWWEEINITPIDESGKNFGWSVKEGPECFEAQTCDATGLVEPTFPMYHERSCALVGGPVYRGRSIPELHGHFLDWTALEGIGNLNSFAVDARGEMYVMNMEGELFRIDPVREVVE
jgi:glucose/arabinose dehydrogenase